MKDTPGGNGGRVQIGIVVTDLTRMTGFYTDIVGLTHFGGCTFPWRDVEDVRARRRMRQTALLRQVASTRRKPPGGAGGGATGLRYLTVDIDNVATMADRSAAAGCSIPMLLYEFEEGVPVVIVEDPEGNWVELIQQVR